MPKVASKVTTKEDVMKKLKANHISLSGMSLVNPTDEMLKGIGQTIVEMLKQKENLLPKYVEPDTSIQEGTQQVIHELAELTPTLYLRVNAS